MTEPIAHLAIPAKDLKMLRESLCTLTTAARYLPADKSGSVKAGKLSYIDKLTKEIDRHRPLGSNGKHGNLHTPTCGCEDK